METENLYVNEKRVDDIELLDEFPRVLLRGNSAFVTVPYSALVWRSPDWYLD